jgi:hypothetical protein
MDPINCVWSETSLDPDGRSHYADATLVNNTLDRADVGCIHRNGFAQLPKGSDGAVVIVHGEHQMGEVPSLLAEIGKLAWAVLIVICDDPGKFPFAQFSGLRRKIWFQMCVPGRHDAVDRKLICGYPVDAPAHLANYQEEQQKRRFNWSFAGQVNNRNRRECLAVLQGLRDGFLYRSPGFWTGLERGEYYRVMSDSKIVACPAGACTPDTLRVAEALEAGCVPVAEDRWPDGYGPASRSGYWEYALGEKPPFPTLTDWREFPAILERELRDWPNNRERLRQWWAGYKQKMCRWLEDDVRAVRGA